MSIRALLATTATALVVVLVVFVVLSGGTHVQHSPSNHAARPTHQTRPASVKPAPRLYWGAAIQTGQGEAPWQMSVVRRFSALLGGKRLSVINWGSQFYSRPYCSGWCAFQTPQFQTVRNYGAIPMISWEPNWKPQIDREIASGAYDSYLTRWARAAKAWGHPFFLRFAWEPNGSWFPWSVGGRRGVSTEGNTPSTYVAMWRHVYDVFRRVGADNATWVWCPNVDAPTTYKPLANLFPGNAYVNWTCMDGYNGDNPWLSFRTLFGATYRQIRRLAPHKPMIIGEISSTEQGGSKAAWISNMFRVLPSTFPDIHGLVWYEVDSSGPGGHSDWRIESSKSAVGAFTRGISSAAFAGNHYSSLGSGPVPVPGRG